jgi:hypothetical protein
MAHPLWFQSRLAALGSLAMGTRLTGFLLALLAGCAWSGGPALEPVSEEEVLAFAERIEIFYRSLEDTPLDSLLTYQDEQLRSHFRDEAEFADYYAALANEVRRASLRNGHAQRVEIREFRFDGPEVAFVDVALLGRHQRGLLFWEIELRRTDTWRLEGGTWILAPEKL